MNPIMLQIFFAILLIFPAFSNGQCIMNSGGSLGISENEYLDGSYSYGVKILQFATAAASCWNEYLPLPIVISHKTNVNKYSCSPSSRLETSLVKNCTDTAGSTIAFTDEPFPSNYTYSGIPYETYELTTVNVESCAGGTSTSTVRKVILSPNGWEKDTNALYGVLWYSTEGFTDPAIIDGRSVCNVSKSSCEATPLNVSYSFSWTNLFGLGFIYDVDVPIVQVIQSPSVPAVVYIDIIAKNVISIDLTVTIDSSPSSASLTFSSVDAKGKSTNSQENNVAPSQSTTVTLYSTDSTCYFAILIDVGELESNQYYSFHVDSVVTYSTNTDDSIDDNSNNNNDDDDDDDDDSFSQVDMILTIVIAIMVVLGLLLGYRLYYMRQDATTKDSPNQDLNQDLLSSAKEEDLKI